MACIHLRVCSDHFPDLKGIILRSDEIPVDGQGKLIIITTMGGCFSNQQLQTFQGHLCIHYGMLEA